MMFAIRLTNIAHLRLDGDILRNVTLEADDAGPGLDGKGTSLYWLVPSLWLTPQALCRSVCPSVSVGYGLGKYDFPQIELRGDIVTPVAEAQRSGTWRIGVELRAPTVTRAFALSIADYTASIKPYYSGERLSRMHMLLVSVAATW